ncbi:hypothetical protein L7F22_026124 [Adiantum nelumboides]|nr:hypothetical protein [Adiantum nelumboides]
MAVAALSTQSDRVEKEFRHAHNGSDNSRKRRREKIVSWPLDEKICEVRHFREDSAPSYVPEDLECNQENGLSFNAGHHATKSAKRARMEHGDTAPPGFGHSVTVRKSPKPQAQLAAARKSLEPQAQLDVLMAIRTPWHLADKFILKDSWLWAGGEESLEVAAQKERERRCFEAFYPRYAFIPTGPWEPQESSVVIDDALVPQIPLEFLEEDKRENKDTELDSLKGNAALHMSEPGEMAGAFCQIKKILCGTSLKQQQPESTASIADSKIAAIAAAACMVVKAWGKYNVVDEKLLIEILENPSLLQSLKHSDNLRQHRDSSTANRQVADNHEPPTHQSSAGHLGHGVSINNPHRPAASTNESARMQWSSSLSSLSLNPLPQRSLRSCNNAESNMDSAEKQYEDTSRVHKHITGSLKMNPSSCSNSPELINPKDYSMDSQTCRMQPTGPSCSLHATCSTILPLKHLPQIRLIEAEQIKYNSALDDILLRKTNAHTKTGRRAKRYCMFYNTPRGCRNGENCPFVHETKSAVNISAQ